MMKKSLRLMLLLCASCLIYFTAKPLATMADAGSEAEPGVSAEAAGVTGTGTVGVTGMETESLTVAQMSAVNASNAAGGTVRIRSVRHVSRKGEQSVTISVSQYGDVRTVESTTGRSITLEVDGVEAPQVQQTMEIRVGSLISVR